MPCCSFPTCGSGSGVTGSIRCVICRLWGGRWRRSSPAVIWFRGLVVLTVRPSAPSSKRWVADRSVTSLDADRVAAVFEELWADRAPATWNTRRVAIQAFASWCGDRWLLAEDLLAGVPPRRRRADNTRAVPYEDLEDLWRRRGVPLREKLLWRMLYETAARASEVLVDGQMRRSVERTPWVGVSWRPAVLSGGGLWVVCGGPPPGGGSALREGSVT